MVLHEQSVLPLPGYEVANIVREVEMVCDGKSQLFRHAGVALTLAGWRGYTQAVLENNPSPSFFAKANGILNSRGVTVLPMEGGLMGADGITYAVIRVDSVRGYTYVSGRTRFPGISQYSGDGGFRGYDQWTNVTMESLREDPDIDPSDVMDIWLGTIFGYPDLAVASLLDLIKAGGHITSTEMVDIPHAESCGGISPQFYCPRQWHTDRSVRLVVDGWSIFLDEFYAKVVKANV